MRFIHAADIHLDSPLLGLDCYEGAPIEAIRRATRSALEKLVDLAISEHVALVLLAGDLYDGDWRDASTGLFFVAQMSRLDQFGIPVVLVSGNHDAASRISGKLPYPKNVHVMPVDEAGTIQFNALRNRRARAGVCGSSRIETLRRIILRRSQGHSTSVSCTRRRRPGRPRTVCSVFAAGIDREGIRLLGRWATSTDGNPSTVRATRGSSFPETSRGGTFARPGRRDVCW